MGYSRALEKLIHEKNFKLQIWCQTPFKRRKIVYVNLEMVSL
jgi:hypothetical protein